ncbi:hypothetical protein A3860_05595 [Niastella vici]|uniref:Uncharacterized protein n=1 Tax=Niastella vici TaxID=1703345 RepID=A0A1V9FSB9_9BACT|nr:hypothetical protein [Niastella vici]OQP61187.1 hypothetical protein A3860_05595 [Niastella vici]
MKINKTIQLKAVFLLIVFSLNTLIGFACAVGVNLGLHAKDTHSHHHHGEAVKKDSHHHDENGAHHHHHDHKKASNTANEDDNCCTGKVSQLSQTDKLAAQTIYYGIEIPVTLAPLHFLYRAFLPAITQETNKIPVARPYTLNSRGIRVCIQSFQI